MSQKEAKKRRQFLRREALKEYQMHARYMAEKNNRLLKNKPGLVPMFLWVWALGFFVNIKK